MGGEGSHSVVRPSPMSRKRKKQESSRVTWSVHVAQEARVIGVKSQESEIPHKPLIL